MHDIEPVIIAHPLSTLTDAQIVKRTREAAPQACAIWLTGKAA